MMKFGVPMSLLADLNKQDAITISIHNLLISLVRPPFDRDIKLATSGHDPERSVLPCHFVNLGHPSAFLLR
jgi:hypothetical protein